MMGRGYIVSVLASGPYSSFYPPLRFQHQSVLADVRRLSASSSRPIEVPPDRHHCRVANERAEDRGVERRHRH